MVAKTINPAYIDCIAVDMAEVGRLCVLIQRSLALTLLLYLSRFLGVLRSDPWRRFLSKPSQLKFSGMTLVQKHGVISSTFFGTWFDYTRLHSPGFLKKVIHYGAGFAHLDWNCELCCKGGTIDFVHLFSPFRYHV